MKYNVSSEFPSYYSHKYLHDKARGRDDLLKLDAELDIADYDRLLNEQKKLKEQWVNENQPFDPEAFREYVDGTLLPEEVQWLADNEFDEGEFTQWYQENEEKVAQIVTDRLNMAPGEPFKSGDRLQRSGRPTYRSGTSSVATFRADRRT